MCDFTDFRNKARAAFRTLNVSVTMHDKQTATSSGVICYKLDVAGMGIGADTLTTEAATAEEAISSMIRKVGQARRLVRAAAEAADQQRRKGQYA